MTIARPEKRKFEVYNILKIRDFLVETNAVTLDEWDIFWGWWCDGDRRTGPADRSLRNVPIGYWGWTEDGKQLPGDGDNENEQAIHKVLVAVEAFFGPDEQDYLVYMEW